jgi:hypothetical protein
MKTRSSAAVLAALSLLAFSASRAEAVVLYAVVYSSNDLDPLNPLQAFRVISFDSAAPGTLLSNRPLTGAFEGGIIGAGFRPSDGTMYLFEQASLPGPFGFAPVKVRVYILDPVTGETALVGDITDGTNVLPFTANSFALAFDPQTDKLRLLNGVGANLVVSMDTLVATGITSGGETLGGPITYSNNYSGTTSTTLYGGGGIVDPTTLSVQPVGNGGFGVSVIATLGRGPTATNLGFRIYAIQVDPVVNGLASVDLSTGAATNLGKIGPDNMPLAFYALCAVPSTALADAAPAFTTGTPTFNAVIGTPYNFTISASGSPRPMVTVTGDLPPGIAFVGRTLTGVPTTAGRYENITVTASNGIGTPATLTFAINVDAAPATDLVRLYQPDIQTHLLTSDPNEIASLPAVGWVNEGVVGRIYSVPAVVGKQKAVPLFRLFSTATQSFVLTTDPVEREALANSGLYDSDGIVGYVLPGPADSTVPLVRVYQPDGTDHLLTGDFKELARLVNGDWQMDGLIGYVPIP